MWAGDIECYIKRVDPLSNSYEYIRAQDNIIDIRDVYEIAKCFNAVISDDLFNSACDLNEDGVINMLDVLIVSKNFGKSSADYSSELTR
ncbi:MAG TPA: dockerin type I domain-containing protein [Pseudobacteroides sp.]|uniref:dockerin type I domain-containing protein n=1 Tax=Pseudobacteroides sp. TaxID=1968840 RepID=UPI002F937D19